jgi:hypothetical protein
MADVVSRFRQAGEFVFPIERDGDKLNNGLRALIAPLRETAGEVISEQSAVITNIFRALTGISDEQTQSGNTLADNIDVAANINLQAPSAHHEI